MPSNSNHLKAMKEAIAEFVEASGGPAVQHEAKDKTKRVLCIFTSMFDLSQANKEELNQVIFNLNALKINVVIFGYEIG